MKINKLKSIFIVIIDSDFSQSHSLVNLSVVEGTS